MLLRLLVALCLLCAAPPASATGPLCGELTVAFYDFGALYYRDGERWTGIDKDVVDELGRRSGCVFTAVIESRVRIWARLEAGSLDMSVSAIQTPERSQFGRFLPYLGSHNYILLDKRLPTSIDSMNAFLAKPSLKLGVVKGYKHSESYEAWITLLRAQGRVYEAVDYSGMIRMLRHGRVDAVITAPTDWRVTMRREELGDAARMSDWAPKDLVVGHLVFSRKAVPQATVDLLERHLRAMRADGTLEAIFKRHVDADMAAILMQH